MTKSAMEQPTDSMIRAKHGGMTPMEQSMAHKMKHISNKLLTISWHENGVGVMFGFEDMLDVLVV